MKGKEKDPPISGSFSLVMRLVSALDAPRVSAREPDEELEPDGLRALAAEPEQDEPRAQVEEPEQALLQAQGVAGVRDEPRAPVAAEVSVEGLGELQAAALAAGSCRQGGCYCCWAAAG